MTYLEAVEFIDYNTIRAIPYAGKYAPNYHGKIRGKSLINKEKIELSY